MLAIVGGGGKLPLIETITNANWLTLGIIALTSGSGALFMYYYGLKSVKAMDATIYELCFPVSAIVFDYYVNGEMISGIQWLSAIIMIVAIININRRRISRDKPLKPALEKN